MANVHFLNFAKKPEFKSFNDFYYSAVYFAEEFINNNNSFCDEAHEACNEYCEQKCYINSPAFNYDWLVVKYNTSRGVQYRIERGLKESEGETYILKNNQNELSVNYIYRNDFNTKREIFETTNNSTTLSSRLDTLLLLLSTAKPITPKQAEINLDMRTIKSKEQKNYQALKLLINTAIDK